MASFRRKERKSEWQALPITSILAQWRHYLRLKMCKKLQVYRPQESAWKPPLPQYATTLQAMRESVSV
jgi:hypothetical protein